LVRKKPIRGKTGGSQKGMVMDKLEKPGSRSQKHRVWEETCFIWGGEESAPLGEVRKSGTQKVLVRTLGKTEKSSVKERGMREKKVRRGGWGWPRRETITKKKPLAEKESKSTHLSYPVSRK